MNINKIVKEFIESDKPIEEFIETIETTDSGLQDTPESSPKPNKKKKDDEDENVDNVNN